MRQLFALGLFLCCYLSVQSEEIRRLVINDFSGGINRSASGVQLNQCWDMVDMNLDSRGSMGPRRGFKYLNLASDSTAGRIIHGLIPYNIIGNKHLLIQRHGPIALPDTSKMTYTTIQSGTKDSTLSELNAVRAGSRPNTGVHAITWQKNMWIASAGSELQVYDGTRMFPARPLGPAQPSAVALDNDLYYTTTLTGTYTYKYANVNGSGVYSNLSAPSFPVQVSDGGIFVSGIIGPDSSGYVAVAVFRSKDNGPYTGLKTASGSLFSFVDTVPVPAGDTAVYPYGDRPRCASSWSALSPGDSLICDTDNGPTPPGALTVDSSILYQVDSGYGITFPGGQDLVGAQLNYRIGYTIVFVDTLGRRSYAGPPFCYNYWDTTMFTLQDDSNIVTYLSGIPLASDNSITSRVILRSFSAPCWVSTSPPYFSACATEQLNDSWESQTYGTLGYCFDFGNWFILDTLSDDTATTYIDSVPSCSTNTSARFYCGDPPAQHLPVEEFLVQTTADNPEDDCLDSVISFKPTVIIQREGQAFAIGHPDFPNRIYFSTFYDPGVGWTPSTWVIDKYFDLPSKVGDWFVALALLNGDIYAFRQHSIVKISGFSFYQYQVKTISEEVGAMSPRSVTLGEDRIYFVDKLGVYETTGAHPNKISTLIDSLWFGNVNVANAIGQIVNGEYWLRTDNVGTIVYNPVNRSWRRYDFIYSHILDYNTGLTDEDWSISEPIIVRGDDSLYQRNTVLNAHLDEWDAVGICSYTSQEFFQGPAREKIHYVDILGQGRLDKITLLSYREGFRTLGNIITSDAIKWGDQSTESIRVRFYIDQIVPAYRFRINCYPKVISAPSTYNWSITSIVIAWQPWDEGRPRP